MIYILLGLMTGTVLSLLVAVAMCRSGAIEDRRRGWGDAQDRVPAPRSSSHDRVDLANFTRV